MFKILMVEDESSIRTIISKYLSKYDIKCIEAENGVKALDLFIKNKDLFILTVFKKHTIN